MKNSDNKYYTPTIEEFHIGFECEKEVWNYISFDEPPGKSYLKINCSLNDIKKIKKNNFRVKHLNKEDIESFGFTHIEACHSLEHKQRSFKKTISKEEIYCFVFDYNTNTTTISVHGIDIMVTGIVHRLFKGKLKNKSELKRLLIQLGII